MEYFFLELEIRIRIFLPQVYRDKLSDSKDLDAFDKAQKDFLKKKFEEMNEIDIMIKPLIFCHFAKYVFWSDLQPFTFFLSHLKVLNVASYNGNLRGIAEAKYMPVSSWSSLNTLLTGALKVI